MGDYKHGGSYSEQHGNRMEIRTPDSQELSDNEAVIRRMSAISHTILVLSGKGGVGKSTVAVNLAVSLMLAGKKVGLLDIDIHGPSVPTMLGFESHGLQQTPKGIVPMQYGKGLKVMSMGLVLKGQDEAVIWRGPLKMQVIKQFIKDVDWGELDYLVVDSPPGTGDEPLSIVQLLPHADGAVIVTTPQKVSVADVKRCINFAHKVNLPVLGVLENMSGFICPGCGDRVDIFHRGGGEIMAAEMGVPFLGSVPIDKAIVDASDDGKPYVEEYPDAPSTKAFQAFVSRLMAELDSPEVEAALSKPTATLRIAVPVANGKLASHFGHCPEFALIDVDEFKKSILSSVRIPSPGHQPGVLPEFLKEHGTQLILTGGMGEQAQELFRKANIRMILGVPEENPDKLALDYLNGSLTMGQNVCDHEH